MQLIPIPTPRVLPDFVACYSARLPGGEGRLHFAAGRQCASRAIEQLLGAPSPDALPRGPAGEPVWPAGLTGSITHTGDFVAAAVARSSAVRGLGLDAEHIVSPERAARVASIVMQPEEARLGPQTVSDALRVTLLFSIKEAVFKCLYPLVLTRFYYPALVVTGLDFDQGIFHAELALPLPGGFPSGYPLSGRFQIEDSRLYSGVCLPNMTA